MSSPNQTPAAQAEKATVILQTVVPIAIRDLVQADALIEARSESSMVKQILMRHYAKRLKARGVQQRRAA